MIDRYAFHLGSGGNCINFIASLTHYNYYSRNNLIQYGFLGTSHNYTKNNNISEDSTKQFFLTRNWPSSLNLNEIDFYYVYIRFQDETDVKFRLVNHYIKQELIDNFTFDISKFGKSGFDEYLITNDFENQKTKIINPMNVNNRIVSPLIVKIDFSDIYLNKTKVIQVIEDITQKKSNSMLEVNYDRYLDLQKKILIQRAPWFYNDEGKRYFP